MCTASEQDTPISNNLTNSPTLEEVQAYFSGDQFATKAAGCTILEGEKGYARCEMKLQPIHYNAQGGVMGGAIFTLADFCLAIACNMGEKPTVSVNNNIQFMSGTKGTKLVAECTTVKSGRSLGFYSVNITDDTGRTIAKMDATCYR